MLSSSPDGWLGITQDPDKLTTEDRKLWDEGMAAAPAGFIANVNTVKMLPRHKVTGRCMLCGETADLTKEHIPPKMSGNNGTSSEYSLESYLNNDNLRELGKGKTQQGGIYGYTLCGQCNSVIGAKYGTEYQTWAASGFHALSQLDLDKMNSTDAPAFGIKIQFGKDQQHPVHPGAFVRQVLSMFCSISGTWDIAATYPDLREIILQDKLGALPDGLDLGITLFAGPHIRMSGPALKLDLNNRTWQWVMEIAYPPFAFLLVLASSKAELLDGTVMNEWPLKTPTEPIVFQTDIAIGFGWGAMPGDYRSEARIKNDTPKDLIKS
jgi:hypothetical protein